MLIGFPASGKSTYSLELAKETNSIILNRDTIGGVLKDLVKLIDKDNNYILDNTNLSIKTRKVFIDKAKELNIEINAIYIKSNIEDCMIRCMNRMYEKYGTIYFEGVKDLSPIVLFKSRKELEEPSLDEGFSDIKVVNAKKLEFNDFNNKCVFLDIDGTLRKTDHLKNKYPINKNEVELLFDKNIMKTILTKYQNEGYMLYGISNQSGICKNILSVDDVIDCMNETKRLLDIEFPITFCPHNSFPIKCYCRKPQSGLFLEAIYKYKINPFLSIMVGDRTEDKTSAKRLNMKYMSPIDFFKGLN
jgi:D-glycero-D-manno-heptose 1,7-bisphosphate phosphatase